MRPLGSDPCQIRTTCAETPDRTLGLSCARTQTTVSRKSMSWEAEPHTASGSSRSSHSRQIHTSPRVSRALSVAGTMVTPQAGQMGGALHRPHPRVLARAGGNDSAEGTHPHICRDREGIGPRASDRPAAVLEATVAVLIGPAGRLHDAIERHKRRDHELRISGPPIVCCRICSTGWARRSHRHRRSRGD